MKIPVTISTDIFAISALLFTIYLTQKNMLINTYKTKYYLKSACIVCLVLILEIFDTILGHADSRYYIIHMLLNIVGFSISPLAPMYLYFLHNEKKVKHNKWIYTPFIIIFILSLTTWKTGWLFYISENNEYIRGTYFEIYPICMLICFVMLVYSDFANYNQYDKDERRFLYSLYSLIIAGTALQLLFPEWLLIWSSISMSLLLYYIFLRELQFKHDPMTGIYNRFVFQRELNRVKCIENTAVIVIDINNLKMINDEYGHALGDDMITKVAQTIDGCFTSFGRTFRTGGDEFCVVYEEATAEVIEKQLIRLDEMIHEISINFMIKIAIAHGYCIYQTKIMKDIYEAYIIADQRMYENKAIFKSKHKKHQ